MHMNKFIFHGVGQGLFYSGHLLDNQYNFVYDCGSESKIVFLNNAIDSLKPIKDIDFVVISHLHVDHYKGLQKLMNDYNVKKIYLPYLGSGNSMLVKLVLAYSCFSMDDEKTSGQQLLADDSRYALYDFMSGIYEGNGDYARDTLIEFVGESDGEQIDNNGYFYTKYGFNDSLETDSYWKFIMFTKRVSDKKLTNLNSKIACELTKHHVASIEQLLERGLVNDVRTIYESVFGSKKLNMTSTVLVHYPIRDMHITYSNSYFARDLFYNNHLTPKRVTSILTGDAEFDAKMLELLDGELTQYGNQKSILQIPHHGSRTNWNKLAKYKLYFNDYVISFGLGNKYCHPSQCIVNELGVVKINSLSLVTQLNSFSYFVY